MLHFSFTGGIMHAGRTRWWSLAVLAVLALSLTTIAGIAKPPRTAADLIQLAEQRFPIDEISGPDHAGRYKLPKPADSTEAREARALLLEATDVGSAEAHRLIGEMIEAGAGGPQDFAAARTHYAAASDNRYAQWRLGLLLSAGKGGAVDLPAARAAFRKSSKAGQIDASYEYARMMELGLGGPKDVVAARALYAKDLEYCHGDNAGRYSIMLMRGIGGPVDRAAAAEMQVKALNAITNTSKRPLRSGSRRCSIARPSSRSRNGSKANRTTPARWTAASIRQRSRR